MSPDPLGPGSLDTLGVVWILLDSFLLEPTLTDLLLPTPSVVRISSGLFGESARRGEVGRGEVGRGEVGRGEGVSGGEMGVGEGEMDPRLE